MNFLYTTFLLLTINLIKYVKLDCGCDKTSREERAAKYEWNSDTSTIVDLINEAKNEDYSNMSLIPYGKYFIGISVNYKRAKEPVYLISLNFQWF